MHVLIRGVAGAVLLLVLMAAPTFADCDYGPHWPSRLKYAQGSTFAGTFVRSFTNDGGNFVDVWDVDHVYAGDDVQVGRARYTFYSCHPARYQAGTRYLVSAPAFGSGSTSRTVAYEILGRGRVQLVGFETKPSRYPKVFQVDRLDQAIARLTGELPPTDVEAATPESPVRDVSGMILVLAAMVAAMAAIRMDRRLSRRRRA